MKKVLIPFLFVVVLIICLRWQGSGLVTPISRNGIIDLELAKTPERFHQLQLFWNPDTVLRSIELDFLFIAAYTWFLVAACKAFRNSKSNVFAALALSAGAFDVLEHFLMLLVWNERFDPSVLGVVYYMAAVKILLVVSVLVYLLFCLFGLFRSKPSS